jgi:hypothetical protein
MRPHPKSLPKSRTLDVADEAEMKIRGATVSVAVPVEPSPVAEIVNVPLAAVLINAVESDF